MAAATIRERLQTGRGRRQTDISSPSRYESGSSGWTSVASGGATTDARDSSVNGLLTDALQLASISSTGRRVAMRDHRCRAACLGSRLLLIIAMQAPLRTDTGEMPGLLLRRSLGGRITTNDGGRAHARRHGCRHGRSRRREPTGGLARLSASAPPTSMATSPHADRKAKLAIVERIGYPPKPHSPQSISLAIRSLQF